MKRYLVVHNLAQRLPIEELPLVVRVVGFRGDLEVALAARLEGVTPQAIQEIPIIRSSRYLLPQMWSLYSQSLEPINERELIEGNLLLGENSNLLGFPLYPLYEEVKGETRRLLEGEPLTKTYLLKMLNEHILGGLPSAKKERWNWPSRQAEGVTLGDETLENLLKVASLALPISLEDERGTPIYKLFEAPQLGGSLAKEFLHAFGPANLEEFIEWSGVGATQGERLWHALDEVVVVQDPQEKLLLREDYLTLKELPVVEGVRLISSSDRLFEIPNRSLLVQGKGLFNYFYRSSNTPPGMLLSDGEVVAGWYLRRHRGSLSIQIEDVGLELGRVANSEIEEEVERLALAMDFKSGGFSLI